MSLKYEPKPLTPNLEQEDAQKDQQVKHTGLVVLAPPPSQKVAPLNRCRANSNYSEAIFARQRLQPFVKEQENPDLILTVRGTSK